MILKIFNPKFCLSDHLNASWSTGVANSKKEKIPVEVAQGIPRLKFSLAEDSEQDWFCGALPLTSTWKSVDLTQYKFLNFTFYANDNSCCRVGFKDEEGADSLELDLNREAQCIEGQESALSFRINSFVCDNFNPRAARLLKIIGYNNAFFYISEVHLSSEPVV
jgi:hypothetical protein